MSWRLHLTNQGIQRLHILNDSPSLLAVWLQRDRVAFYDLETGTPYDEMQLSAPDDPDRQSDVWQNYLAGLIAPNKAYLPFVEFDQFSVHLTDDGRMRLYYTRNDKLFLEADGQEVALSLTAVESIHTLAFDRFLGFSALLDEKNRLHIFQQHIPVGIFDLEGLIWNPELRPMLAISRAGSSIYVSDGQRLLLSDSAGTIRKVLDTYYFVRQIACSPNGNYIVLSDVDTGVIRVYDGSTLTLTHQRFAIDLVAHARQVQLLADLPPYAVAPRALAINDKGILAFAMSGVICVSDLSNMEEVPRPQTLL